jgi:adenylate cyclase
LKNHNENFSVSKDIVMVNLDDRSIAKIWSFPFSRDIYTTTIKNLQEKNASVIAFDIILSDNWPNKNVDNNLAKQIFDSKRVVLGSPITDNWVKSIIPPLNKFLTGWLSYWFFPPNIHKITWESYSFSPSKNLNITKKLEDSRVKNTKKSFNHFAVEILKKYLGRDKITFSKNWFSIVPWEIIPYSSSINNNILINYMPKNKFENQISLSDIYFKNGDFNNVSFDGKIVLIWATAEGLKDIFNTPNGVDFWVYIHGNILNTVLSQRFLIYFDENLEWLLIFLIIILAVYFNLSSNNKTVLFSNIILITLFILLNKHLLDLQIWIVLNHPAYMFLAFTLSIMFSNIVKYITENKDKKKMIKALWEYISKDIAQEILHDTWSIKLEWERKRISIFFSDIEWFTSISEKMNPEELVVFLREYLWVMSNIIMDERWLIDKYEWDAIMALWWVFWHVESSTYDNCNSALYQQAVLKKLNSGWKERFWEELKIRMWLHTGDAIVWNIWATWRKMEFTALWDSVNLASRLEEVNKKYGTYLCVSQTIYEEQKENFEFRYLDKIKVKWKNIPVGIYELLSKLWELPDSKKDIILSFNIWIELYLKQEFKKAREVFEKLWKEGDKPSLTYIERCKKFELIWPGTDWDWVWTMKTK